MHAAFHFSYHGNHEKPFTSVALTVIRGGTKLVGQRQMPGELHAFTSIQNGESF